MKLVFLFVPFILSQIKKINQTYKLYPQWIRKPDRSLIPCEKDEDCLFPAACCNEPFFPVKYCCYGWNKRKLQYAYIVEYVK